MTGWNFIRVAADHSAVGAGATWGTIHKIEILVNSTNTVAVTIGHLYLETPPKARMLLVIDRGYKSFMDLGYPALKAAGIPVTLAADVHLFGTGVGGASEVMTEADVAVFAGENNNSVSFHGVDGGIDATMTAAELRTETMTAIKWLQLRGYTGRMWRAAFMQNNAPQWAAVKDLVLFARSGVDLTNRNGPWPPINPMMIPPQQTDNTTVLDTPAKLDAKFAELQRTHALYVPFIHGISATQFDMTPALFAAWLGRVTAAIAAGWLEAVTLEQLFYEAGGSFSAMGGSLVARYTDASGATVTKNVL